MEKLALIDSDFRQNDSGNLCPPHGGRTEIFDFEEGEYICRIMKSKPSLEFLNSQQFIKKFLFLPRREGAIKSTSATHTPILAKAGFTLAEVLITLGIIGVVAAMTIPNLIFSCNEAITVNKVKKTNSVLANALKLAIEENGEVDGWNFENVGGNVNSAKNSQMLAKNIMSHLKVVQDCGFQKDCMLDVDFYMLNGSKWNTYTNYRDKFYYKMVLIDGSYLIVKSQGNNCNYKDGGYDNTCGYFLYDVNGNKKPNTFGKDVFIFEILPDTVVPKKNDGAGKDGDNVLDYAGTSAASYIIKNGNMRYLKNL